MPELACETPLPASDAKFALRETARLFYDRGWAFGTSGNYSVVLDRDPLRLLITASGRDKRALSNDDFVIVDADGHAIDPSQPRPSAETLLHCVLAARPNIGAVLHTHSIWNTLLSSVSDEAVTIAGYEMLKGLAGVETHETTIAIPVFENTQDIPALAGELQTRLAGGEGPSHGFLMRGHGLYTWGRDLAEARRHIEVLEFLFEVEGRSRSLFGGA
ncbi:MAG: methylthioribulose 1-phosphate dehydratase [Phycisphaerales bacterium]|nr:methylthioribulose 1-phosphate dehydratase [Phycisphaerales bacterium]